MRLSKNALAAIEDVTRRASAGQCTIRVNAPNRSMAAAMFRAVTSHIEPAGGAPVMRSLSWRFANGSVIVIVVESRPCDGAEAMA